MPRSVSLPAESRLQPQIKKLEHDTSVLSDLWFQTQVYIVLTGIVWFGFETVRWLKLGVWSPYTTSHFVRAVLDNEWLANPRSWIGFHRLVAWFAECVPVIGHSP